MSSDKPELSYFIFGNKPQGEYQESFWDTRTILQIQEIYFATTDDLTHKPRKGDIVLFKEFDTKVYWGEALLDSSSEQIVKGGETMVRFRLKDLQKWIYQLKTNTVYS